MTPLLSRIAVVAAGLPIVIGAAVVGGWFLFGVVAVAGLVGLHEFYRLARDLRPLVLAGYGGALGAYLGAELGDAAWMLAGFLVVFPLAFMFAAVSAVRQSTTVAISSTVMCAAWVGFWLAHLILLHQLPDGKDAILAVLFTVFTTDTLAYVGGLVSATPLSRKANASVAMKPASIQVRPPSCAPRSAQSVPA